MKKYIMPIVKVAAIKPTVILTGSDPKTDPKPNNELGNGSIMSKGSQSLFDTEDDI